MSSASLVTAGIVYSDGSFNGQGFSVTKKGTGTYEINYPTKIYGAPVPIVTGMVNNQNGSPNGNAEDNVYVVKALGADAGGFTFTVYSYDLVKAGTDKAQDVLQDSPFNFVVFESGS